METFNPQPARLLDLVRSDVERVILKLRPKVGPIHIEGMASRLGLEIAENTFSGPVRGATLGDSVVLLDGRLRGSLRAEVFAHEIGHVLHRRGWFTAIAPHQIELFADQFARELLVPSPWLSIDRRAGAHLARRLQVSHVVIALQLAANGIAPPLMRDGETVLCGICGVWPQSHSCRCRAFRQDDRSCRRLRDYRALPAFDRPCSPRENFDQLMFGQKILTMKQG